MKIDLNAPLVAICLLVILAASVLAYSSSIPNPGHGADTIWSDFGGTEMNLQDTLDIVNQKIENLEMRTYVSDCTLKRSTIGRNDRVIWCPDTHEIVIHCSESDDQAPDEIPTPMDTCLADGECDATGLRGNLGTEDVYLELVENVNTGTQGCWAYDNMHTHQPYKLDLICCDLV